jgi:TonB family protein
MKHLRALLILLLVCSWLQTVRAQAADSWISVSPAGEQFTIQMPNSPVVNSQQDSFEQFKVDGHTYTASSDGVDYTVWSLVNENYAGTGPTDNDAYLDACADLVWESLLKPLRDQLPKLSKLMSHMSYHGELSKLAPGREYTITLGARPGLTRFYVAGQQIYVLTVLNANADSAATQRFVNSFALKIPGLPVTTTEEAKLKPSPSSAGVGTGIGGGIGPGQGGNIGGGPSTGAGASTDYNRVFPGRDVTEKARVLSKPEPQYTESARRYAVQGTVILRAIFSSSGEVNSIKVVKKLPHGLTQRAIAAARQIKFTPASKDGHAVSMYIQLEYNFNLY